MLSWGADGDADLRRPCGHDGCRGSMPMRSPVPAGCRSGPTGGRASCNCSGDQPSCCGRYQRTPGGLTLQELVTRLGIPLASMHRLLAALSEERLVVRSSSTRRYVIGP